MTATTISKIILWDVINPFFLKLKKNRKIRLKDGFRGINLGCGFDNPDNWLGLDGGASLVMIKRSPKFMLRRSYKNFNMSESMGFEDYFNKVKSVKFLHHDIRYGLPFEDNSVPHVFSSHFFEHLTKENTQALLAECYRVMKPKGIIRIVVPSLDEAVESISQALEEYRKGKVDSVQKFVTNLDSGYLDSFSGHKWMYNFQEMSNILKEAGFSEITECEFRKGRIPDVEELDCRVGLIVEAVK